MEIFIIYNGHFLFFILLLMSLYLVLSMIYIVYYINPWLYKSNIFPYFYIN